MTKSADYLDRELTPLQHQRLERQRPEYHRKVKRAVLALARKDALKSTQDTAKRVWEDGTLDPVPHEADVAAAIWTLWNARVLVKTESGAMTLGKKL